MLFFHVETSAQDDQNPALACPGPTLAPMMKSTPDRSASPISVKSRMFDANLDGKGHASGNVELRRADQLMVTELLQYDPENGTITIPGEMQYKDAVFHLSGTNASYNFIDENGHFSEVDYGLTGSSARGSAEELIIDSENHSVLRMLRFSTCPGEQPQWVLTAKHLELDFDKGTGTAKRAKLKFFDFPILYLPYMTFPIDDRRKSGFLYPFISTANDNGLEFGIPYYWNIAPNQDATITPRHFSARGGMLTGEYRFLTRNTGGALDFDYMPDDANTGETRYHYKFIHSARFSPRWGSRILLDRVSDDQYFQDFANSLAASSRQYLRNQAGIDGSGRYWTFSLIADDFQVVDEAVNLRNEPYRRLPRMGFRLDRPLGNQGLRAQLDTELVYFDRDLGATGSRFDIYPRIEWNLETDWGYLRPSAGYRYTSYNLDWHGLPGDESPDRGTEIVSVDTGLFLERDTANGMLQTLEPRLFYLYVPYENQDGFPDFDSAPFTFGFSQLFHFNRFTGADRQSDANQLTLALTTRSFNQATGHELWSLSFGQIIYFDDQKVTSTPFDEPLDDDASPFIAEITYQPTRQLSGRLSAQWDWQSNEIDVAIVGLEHRAANGRRLGAEYRFRRDSLDQFDLRYYHPLNESWRLLSRVNYSLKENDLLAAEAGFQYDSCCWALRVVARRFLKNRDGDHRDAIYIQLTLKGLASIGRKNAPLFYDLAE
jgi:LPS-assembly protein